MPYKIPSDTNPTEVECIKVYVPNDTEWRSLFWGAFSELARYFNYEMDGTHNAADVAKVWRTLFLQTEAEYQAGGGCGIMDVRTKPDDSCILQKSTDGETWEDWANINECQPAMRINPETCLLEVNCSSDPDNPNWQPVKTSAYDPRFDDIVPEPYPDGSLPEGQDPACVAAANAAAYFDYASLGYSNAIGGGSVLGAICAAIMSYVSAIQQVVFNVVLARVAIDFVFYNPATIVADQAAFDWDELKNILVCYFDNHGNASKTEYIGLQEAILARFDDSQIWRVIYSIISMIGPIGLTNVAKWAAITEAECDTCLETWEYDSDLESNLSDWFAATQPYDGQVLGVYSGDTWHTEYANAGNDLLNIKSPDIIPVNVRLTGVLIEAKTAIGTPYHLLQFSKSADWSVSGDYWSDLVADTWETREATFAEVDTRAINVFLRQQQHSPTGEVRRVKLTGVYV